MDIIDALRYNKHFWAQYLSNVEEGFFYIPHNDRHDSQYYNLC